MNEVTVIWRMYIINAGGVGFQGDVIFRIGIRVLGKLKATGVDLFSGQGGSTKLDLRMRDWRIEELYVTDLLPQWWRGLIVHTLRVTARKDELEWEPGTRWELRVGVIVTRENGFTDVEFG